MYPKPHDFPNLIFLIQENRDLRGILFQEFIDRFPAFFRVYAEHDQAFGLILIIQFSREGASFRQFGHQVAQKGSKRTFPRNP